MYVATQTLDGSAVEPCPDKGALHAAVGSMQHRGIPIDLDLLDKLNAEWDDIKLKLVTVWTLVWRMSMAVLKRHSFNHTGNEDRSWAADERFALDRDTFSDMSKRYPNVQPCMSCARHWVNLS